MGLALLLAAGLVPAHAQQQPDAADTTATGVEPAALDTLPAAQFPGAAIPGETESPSADTGEVDRVFVNADSLSAIQQDGEQIQELFENVFIRQDTTRLRSEYARRYLEREEVLFITDVVIYERGDTLRADTVRYDRAAEVGYARGNVRLTDGEVTVRATRGTYFVEEKRSVFPDSVVLVDSSRTLRARRGTYWSDERRAEFSGGVELTEPGTRILADSLTYYRDRDRSVAWGDVFIDRWDEQEGTRDSTTHTYLFGDRVDNREQHRYTRVAGRALLFRVRSDSAGAETDTLVVRARQLDAFRTDTHRRLIAVDSVRVWQPDLSAVADSAVYDRVVATTPDTTAGQTVPIDTTRPPPDSLGLTARANTDSARVREDTSTAPDSLQGRIGSDGPRDVTPGDSTARPDSAAVPPDSIGGPVSNPRAQAGGARSGRGPAGASSAWPTPTAQDEERLPLEEIRLHRSPVTWFEDSQAWGDSIRVVAHNGSPDTVFVRGSAFTVRQDTVLDRRNQLKARNLTAFFRSDSLRRIVARPNAQAIYFLASEADSLLGAKRASGDQFVLHFSDGTVERAVWKGGVEGVGYPNPENIPSPFELEGFRWTPERRPTRAKLLRDPRVRRRLDMQSLPSRRPVAQRPSRNGPPPVEAMRSTVPTDTSGRVVPRDSLQGRSPAPPDSLVRPAGSTAAPDTSTANPESNP